MTHLVVILSLILLQTTLDFIVAQSISFDLRCCFIQSIIMEKSKLTFCTYRYLHIFINLIQQYFIYAIYVNIMIQIAIFYYLQGLSIHYLNIPLCIFEFSLNQNYMNDIQFYKFVIVLEFYIYLISLSIDDMQFNCINAWLLNHLNNKMLTMVIHAGYEVGNIADKTRVM